MGLKRKSWDKLAFLALFLNYTCFKEGTLENTGYYEYCMTIPSTFVQDCYNLRIVSQLFS